MARAAEYAKNSRSWLQLVSIIRYTWNVFSYDLTNPLELTQGDGWHYVLLIAECSLFLVEAGPRYCHDEILWIVRKKDNQLEACAKSLDVSKLRRR